MKKGFTLVELLAVIALLSILLLVGTASMTKVIKENKQAMHDEQIQTFISAVKAWGYENTDELPLMNNSKKITLRRLVEDGAVSSGVEDPLTGNEFSLDTYFCITNTNGLYTYTYNGDC